VTWTGSFSVPAGGTATLTFAVTASTVEGTYTNSVDGASTGELVAGSGATAPVTVTLALAPRFTG
jgi:hypothetical protein